MGRYTAMTEVGEALVKLLRKHLAPEIIHNPELIGLCNPSDKGGYTVGIYLYDVREAGDFRINTMSAQNLTQLKYPPICLSLYYMITVISAGDVKFKSGEEQKILGKIIQVFHDCPCLDTESFEPVQVQKPLDITIKMQQLSLDEKTKIYNVPNAGYQLSLFYKVSPVEIESVKTRTVSRVMEVNLNIEEQK